MSTDNKFAITICLIFTLIAASRVDPCGVALTTVLLLAVVYALGKRIDPL